MVIITDAARPNVKLESDFQYQLVVNDTTDWFPTVLTNLCLCRYIIKFLGIFHVYEN